MCLLYNVSKVTGHSDYNTAVAREDIMKNYDITALGELLVDMTDNGIGRNGVPVLEANPGGAPCNVLSMMSKLGKKTAFIGKVGNDGFGRMLADVLVKAGIDTTGLILDNKHNTTLAIVHTMPGGEREFSFYRKNCADTELTPDEVNTELIRNSRIFHFGSLSMTSQPVQSATERSIETAKAAGALISFDPNLRPSLWDDLETARERIDHGMRMCDVLKISDNEVEWFLGTNDYRAAAEELRKRYSIPLVLVTLGKDGSLALSENGFAQCAGFRVNSIEATGAGDSFCGCVLNYILEHGFHDYADGKLTEMLTFANAAAAIVTTRKGVLNSMPDRSLINTLINDRRFV